MRRFSYPARNDGLSIVKSRKNLYVKEVFCILLFAASSQRKNLIAKHCGGREVHTVDLRADIRRRLVVCMLASERAVNKETKRKLTRNE